MKYDIYFHNDFDGRASAAVLLSFLRSRGDSVGKYVALAYDVKPNWRNMRFKNPTILVDFIYHPNVAWWYDHHVTSFIRKDWQNRFRQTKFSRWDSKYPSCCSLVLDSLKKDFKFKAPSHLKELARWLDVIDAAKFKSAKQTIEFKEPALRIMKFIDSHSSRGESLSWLINLLSAFSLKDIARHPRIMDEMKRIKKERDEAFAFYKKHLKIIGKTGVIDFGSRELLDLRFAMYYLKPDLRYNMIIKEIKSGFRFTVGTNPWGKVRNGKNIGELLARFGGGGHKAVGGLTIPKDKKEKERISEFIIQKLSA